MKKMSSSIAIIDIDGVVANSDARFAQATTNGKIDWKVAFNPDLVELDTLIEGCPALLNNLDCHGDVIFLTSRPEPMRNATELWLSRHGLLGGYLSPFNRRLIMKPLSKQFVKTKVWKAEVVQQLIEEMQPKQVIFVDDERANIESVTALLPDVVCFLSLADVTF